jgi:hypothetical protein
MIATRFAALAIAISAASLATFGAAALAPSQNSLAPKVIVAQAFDTVAMMPAAPADLRAALAQAVRADRQPTLKTDRTVRTATIERRHGNVSTLVRLPVATVAQL